MIQIKNIIKDYLAGDNVVHALSDVSINFREKEFVSILGPSGCGKTTLLNILGGLDRYSSGDLIIDKVSTKDYKDKDWDTYRNHYVGFVFQNYNLIMHLNVLENVELALSIAGMSKKEKREKAKNALEKVGLSDQINKKPNQLSGGQMQRVAIARAIVNNPKIILADEPTGALDSETSVQVMEILKELSKEHLIIMVTHNQTLAERYSTRTIELLDGKITSDSNPLKDSKKLEKFEKDTGKHSAMNFATAFALSIKNLFTKKAKTILTSFAGSIGIIGIALVLAVNTGFTNYINNLQSDTLSGYPISVPTVTVDYGSVSTFFNNQSGEMQDFPTDNKLNVYDMTEVIGQLGHYNFISDKFIDFVQDFVEEDKSKNEENRLLNSVEYSYSTRLNVLTRHNGNIIKAKTDVSTNSIYGTTSSLFFEGLANKDFVLSSYEMLEGTYPTTKNEILLVVKKNNAFSKQTLDDLGIDYSQTEDGFDAINFSEIIGKQYKLILNNDWYSPNYENEVLTSFTTNEINQELYDNANNLNLTISGVMRIKEDIATELFEDGIMYLPSLTEYFKNNCKNSLIAQKSRENNIFYEPFTVDITELKSFLGNGSSFSFYSPTQIKTFVKSQYDVEMTLSEATELGLQAVGASDIPSAIYFYPKTFEAKDKILEMIKEWNESPDGEFNKIIHTDSTGFLSDTLGQLIDIISYVLIAFAGISLVVSSIMIGIITYTSVVERTKEIGVLRSIGARKKDISRVFNAETIIVGLLAGIIGIGLSYLLTIPINAIIKSVAGGSITTNLASLELSKAGILVLISVVLTFVAGLIPSRIAAKKDPVKALRTE